MNFQQLTTFCKVLSEGSMTAAADRLLLTQPAVSQQIRSLEDELGVPLLVRGVRKVRPSVQGQLLYDYAKRILHLTQQAEVSIQSVSGEMQGDLRVGTTNSFGLHFISPVIGLFLRHNQHLSLNLSYGSTNELIASMRKGDLDMAVLPDLKTEFGVELDRYASRFVMEDEMWLVGSTKDVTLPTRIDALKVFNTRPIAALIQSYPSFNRLLKKRFKEMAMNIKPVFETDNVGTLKRVVESGLGWAFMPAHSIRKQVRTRRLSRVHVGDLKYAVNINLYWVKEESVAKKAETFFRAICQQHTL